MYLRRTKLINHIFLTQTLRVKKVMKVSSHHFKIALRIILRLRVLDHQEEEIM